jgi:hypothetical protein
MDTIPTYDASVTGTVEKLVQGSQKLHTVEVENPNTTVVYLQLFDAAATTDVTLGTTAPTTTRLIPAGDGTNNGARILDFSEGPVRFNNGICYAITTTRSGSTSPSTACPVNFTHS